MIVVDASVLVDAFIGDAAAAARIRGEELHAPHLVDLEVASALRRLESAGTIGESDAGKLLRGLAKVDLHRHGHTALLGQVWSLRSAVNPYDGVYVALATALDAPLVTSDKRLASVPNLTCAVELV